MGGHETYAPLLTDLDMKAPDKIYIHVRTEPRPSITFSEIIEKNSTNEKYIRKDALLEKLEKVVASYKKRSDEGELLPQLPDNLDEAAEEQTRSFGYMKEDYEYKELIENFKVGAEWMARQIKQEQSEPTCKTCGFYENNCPFIRGKLIPYPNKVCKDYTYSVMKEHEQPEVDFKIEERKWVHDAVDNIFPEDGDFMSEVDFRKILKDTARHFYELGMSVMKERITNPDYNQKVIEKIKSEYPIDEANARKEESK